MQDTSKKAEWTRLLANQYFDYKEGRQPLDPLGAYKLSELLQSCVFHDATYHMDCIYLNTRSKEAWMVKGSTCNIHRDKLHEVPLSEQEPLRIGSSFNVLDEGRLAEPKAISFGLGFPRGEYQWFFCDRCVDIIQLKHDLLHPIWTNQIVEKYMNIWVDWSMRPWGGGRTSW